jgi:hypothetical protein
MSAPRQYVFSYSGNLGPVRKVFGCVMQFDAYVRFWRNNVSPVEFMSMNVARGCL